ncbi:MAG: radical SAM protein [Candidatus Peregrinibacteria bacterium]|nr:radical SAM protein [Candidatus Peregrinibacteria bacterium]
MIKSVNQLVTERCNSQCKMCSIWKIKDRAYEMNPEEFDKLYSNPEFKEVEDLCISGGEATLRTDLFEVIDSMIKNMPKLNMLFLSTNGSNPNVAKNFAKKYSPKIKDVYICLSLEGDKEVHKKIRGVDTYNKVLETAELIKDLNIKNCHVIFSTTIVPENCNQKSLNHVKKIAKKLNCTFSFRPASQNDTFYHNRKSDNFIIDDSQIKFLENYMISEKMSDPFLDILFESIKGKETIMGSKKCGIKCLAGDISIFTKSNGDIFPCINSSRLIGDKERGIFEKRYKVGSKELCPCCTECQIYPMLNFSKYSDKNGKQN